MTYCLPVYSIDPNKTDVKNLYYNIIYIFIHKHRFDPSTFSHKILGKDQIFSIENSG